MNSFLATIARSLIYIIGLLPLPVARALGSGLGRLSWLAQDRGALTTTDNLRMCFPRMQDEEREALAKKSLRETYKIAGETFVVWQRGRAWCEKHTLESQGEELLRTPLAQGKGVIVAMPHMGNWEFLGSHLARFAKATCMYQPPKKDYMENIVLNGRTSLDLTLVPTNRKGITAQLKALNAGELVAILPDQVPTQGGIYSPFFGLDAFTMTLIHGFVQRTGCKVVMGFAQRFESGFKIFFIEPPAEIYSSDEQVSVSALNRGIEQCVAMCPEQYQWEYKRFKKRLGDGPDSYRA